jgi:hypothetical protein
MKKFLVLFLTPVSVMEGWMSKSPEERKDMEEKMQIEWKQWMEAHKDAIVEMPAGAGKTKSISSTGVIDTKNDVMMYGIVQAENPEDAAALFAGHPHLEIPEATIEVMAVNPINP